MGNHFDTILTPMKDFRIPKGNSLTNAYKQGKVGEHPKIGDYRLNLKKFGFNLNFRLICSDNASCKANYL